MIVDDGSKDDTQRVIHQYLNVKANNVRCLKLGVNCGKGEAVRRGVRKCRGRYILMVRHFLLQYESAIMMCSLWYNNFMSIFMLAG